MSAKSLIPAVALLFATPFALPAAPALAQDAQITQGIAREDGAAFSVEELDQILAPIALYPDELLSNVLIAATYPLEVVEAARWIDEPENADLKGAALTSALSDKDWDPSVKSLTQFPEVLTRMSDNLDWMHDLGDAFLADQASVMDRIQFLRMKADDAGHLESNERQRVVTRYEDDRDYIYIEPAEPDVIYVPVYEPAVYGPWWYPDYPPYYWDYDYAYVDFYYWGWGVAIAPSLWHWNRPSWRRHYIHIDPRRYNRLSHRKRTVKSTRWRHDAHHRRGVRRHDDRARRRPKQGPKKFGLHSGRKHQPNVHRRTKGAKAKRDRGPRRQGVHTNPPGRSVTPFVNGGAKKKPSAGSKKRHPPQVKRKGKNKPPANFKRQGKKKPPANAKKKRNKKPQAKHRGGNKKQRGGNASKKRKKPGAGKRKKQSKARARGNARKSAKRRGGGKRKAKGGGRRKQSAKSRGGGKRKAKGGGKGKKKKP